MKWLMILIIFNSSVLKSIISKFDDDVFFILLKENCIASSSVEDLINSHHFRVNNPVCAFCCFFSKCTDASTVPTLEEMIRG